MDMQDANDNAEAKNLGRVQLRTPEGKIILVPKPSSDPNDPLNWSQPFKIYLACLVCFGMLMCTFLAAGPTVAIVQVAQTFGGGPEKADLTVLIPQVAFFFTTSALTQGTGNLIWEPLINKYGRRPWYLIAFTGYLGTALWSGYTSNYTSELIARILLGFFSGAGECLGPATISDLFFLHERASMMAIYNFAVGSGVSIGIICSGFITLNHSWRVIYLAGAIMIGILVLLVFFTFPETAYNRTYVESEKGDILLDQKNPYRLSLSIILEDNEKDRLARYWEQQDQEAGLDVYDQASVLQRMEARIRRLESTVLGKQQYEALNGYQTKSYASKLKIFTGQRYTGESIGKMFIRPFGLILLPPVLWATTIMAVTIGFNVAISSAFASDFARVYNFTPFQSGLGFFGSLVGGILAIPLGGPVGEAVANYFTVRNNGIRDPEFRLPAMIPSAIAAPLGLFLYGLGLQEHFHFMVPIVGIGLLTFAIGQGINISFVYMLDAYPNFGGEVTIAQLAFKSVIGFGLSAATNTWIADSGELAALSEMAAISFFVFSLAIPLFFWGARLRRASLKWSVVQFLN